MVIYSLAVQSKFYASCHCKPLSYSFVASGLNYKQTEHAGITLNETVYDESMCLPFLHFIACNLDLLFENVAAVAGF